MIADSQNNITDSYLGLHCIEILFPKGLTQTNLNSLILYNAITIFYYDCLIFTSVYFVQDLPVTQSDDLMSTDINAGSDPSVGFEINEI